jgi:5-methylcytosine-specific restriction endonuclease McrA
MLTEKQIQIRKEWAARKDHANERRRAAYLLKNQEMIFARLRRREEAAQAETLRREAVAICRATPPLTKQERRTFQKELIQDLKRQPCRDCGGIFHAEAMEFDHVLGDKEFNISKIRGRSMKRLKKEIAKCDLICANCHRARTARRRAGLPATLPPPDYEI